MAAFDARRLYAAAFLRALAAGYAGVWLGLHLGRLGLDGAPAGAVVAAGLGGGALAAAAAMFGGDRAGRRRSLIGLCLVAAAGGAALIWARAPGLLVVAAFVGMVNGMGRDRGAALVLEQAALPQLVDADGRTRAFAVYNVAQDAGHALGSLVAGWPSLLLAGTEARAQAGVFTYVALVLAPLVAYVGLSAAVEGRGGRGGDLSPESRGIIGRLCGLFALDAAGSGFLTTAFIVHFFQVRFGTSGEAIAALFFAARVANAGSHLGAAWLARRIGLVNTMVFTHMPSSLLLCTVAVAPSFPIAAGLFLLRESLVEMDVPTRQSYVVAVVREEERTRAAGYTHLVRLVSWAVAPGLAGLLVEGGSLWLPLVVGAGLKIAYDLLLWMAFRRVPQRS